MQRHHLKFNRPIALSVGCLSAALLWCSVGAAAAQITEQDSAIHCAQQSLPADIRKLPPPRLRPGMGNSAFAISNATPEAQEYFNQGLNALHSFWDIEALRSFLHAARLAPNAAMPHWGVAMSIPQAGSHELVETRSVSLTALGRLRDQASVEEQYFIDAVLARFDPQRPREAASRYVEKLEALARRFPENLEAKLFLGRAQLTGYDTAGRPTSPQRRSEQFLEQALRRVPKSSAAHHYWIHAVELSPTPERGLESARVLPALAPASAHIQHMPGHIFFLLGRYSEALTAFRRAHAVDVEYMKSDGISSVDNWNYVHNLEYLVAVAVEAGQDAEATEWAKLFSTVLSEAQSRKAAGAFKIAYDAITAQVRQPFRAGTWSEALEILSANCPQALTPASGLYCTALRDYALVRSLLLTDDIQAQNEAVETLTVSSLTLNRAQVDDVEAGFTATAQVIVAGLVHEARALVKVRDRDLAGALPWFEQAREKERSLGYREPPAYPVPVAETKAQALLAAGELVGAQAAIDLALAERKNAAPSLRIALALARAQGNAAAESRYQQLLGPAQ